MREWFTWVKDHATVLLVVVASLGVVGGAWAWTLNAQEQKIIARVEAKVSPLDERVKNLDNNLTELRTDIRELRQSMQVLQQTLLTLQPMLLKTVQSAIKEELAKNK